MHGRVVRPGGGSSFRAHACLHTRRTEDRHTDALQSAPVRVLHLAPHPDDEVIGAPARSWRSATSATRFSTTPAASAAGRTGHDAAPRWRRPADAPASRWSTPPASPCPGLRATTLMPPRSGWRRSSTSCCPRARSTSSCLRLRTTGTRGTSSSAAPPRPPLRPRRRSLVDVGAVGGPAPADHHRPVRRRSPARGPVRARGPPRRGRPQRHRQLVSGRASANRILGAERVFDWSDDARKVEFPPGAGYAELVTEAVRVGDAWRLGRRGLIAPGDPLAAPSETDVGWWIAAASVTQQLTSAAGLPRSASPTPLE